MAWKNRRVRDRRLELVLGMLRGVETVRELCRRFGVSRKTAYKWKARHEAFGYRGLADRPPVAARVPKRLTGAWKAKLLRLHRRHPRWGPRKIRALAAAERAGAPSESSVKRRFAWWGWVRIDLGDKQRAVHADVSDGGVGEVSPIAAGHQHGGQGDGKGEEFQEYNGGKPSVDVRRQMLDAGANATGAAWGHAAYKHDAAGSAILGHPDEYEETGAGVLR